MIDLPEIFISRKAGDSIEPITITLDRVPAPDAAVRAELRDPVDGLVYRWSTSTATASVVGFDIVLAAIDGATTQTWPAGLHGFEVQVTEGSKTTTEINREDLEFEILGDGAHG